MLRYGRQRSLRALRRLRRHRALRRFRSLRWQRGLRTLRQRWLYRLLCRGGSLSRGVHVSAGRVLVNESRRAPCRKPVCVLFESCE